MFVVSPVLS